MQRDAEWVNAASAEQIAAAQAAGELDALLGRRVRTIPPIGREDLERWLTTAEPDEIVAAYAEHLLDPVVRLDGPPSDSGDVGYGR